MVVDEKTYKDLIYKIASEDSGFKRILDERIDMYKKDSFEIEQLKNRAYTFCNRILIIFKLDIDRNKFYTPNEFISIVMDKFNKMVSETVGRAVKADDANSMIKEIDKVVLPQLINKEFGILAKPIKKYKSSYAF